MENSNGNGKISSDTDGVHSNSLAWKSLESCQWRRRCPQSLRRPVRGLQRGSDQARLRRKSDKKNSEESAITK